MEERTKRVLPIKNVINLLMENYNLTDKVKENHSINIWPKIVGSKVSQVTKPVRIKQGILYIKVKNDIWRNEIVYQKKIIKDKMNNELGEKVIRDIKFI